MKVVIVILNWNGKALLEKYLPNVVKFSNEAKVVVVDNHSSDDSVSFLEKQFPTVQIVKHSENFGYAEGYNHALKMLDGDLFCLLNSDIRVTKNWLDPIVTHFTNHPKTAIAQPKILCESKPDTFEYAGAAGGYLDRFGYPFCRGRVFKTVENDRGQYDDTASIFWASGACFFIRPSVFKKLKGFDSDFFAHFEEIDLCWRAAHNHLQVVCVGESSVYHLGGGTLSYQSPQKLYLNIRNSLFTLVKNLPNSQLLPIIVTRMILDGFLGVFFLITLRPHLLISILKAHYSFYKLLGVNYKKRKFYNKINQYFVLNSIIVQYFILRKPFFNDLKIRVKKKLASAFKSE